jgi:hypothetical protein
LQEVLILAKLDVFAWYKNIVLIAVLCKREDKYNCTPVIQQFWVCFACFVPHSQFSAWNIYCMPDWFNIILEGKG